MEKKKLYRVAGILILVALVIVIVPLLTGKNELPFNKTLSVEAPPFPEGSSESTAESELTASTPAEHVPNVAAPISSAPEAHPTAEEKSASTASLSSPVGPVAAAHDVYKDEPAYPAHHAESDVAPAVMPPAAETTVASAQVSDNLPQTTLTDPPADAQEMANPEKPAPKKFIVPMRVHVTASAVSQHKSGIRSVWVVQMGNFHIHTNAIRFANRLKSAGYKVYTRQIVSRTGQVSTRVYVGPEMTEVSAKKLSARIHEQMNLDGIVVPVEPLAI